MSAAAVASNGARQAQGSDARWGTAMLIPYLALFLAFVIYPVAYGFYLGSDPASYRRIFADPAYRTTLVNTALFLLIAVNVKMFLALIVSGFFVDAGPVRRAVGLLFILPWAIPSFISILSFRWMLNPEWGMLNNIWFQLFGTDGPAWLLDRPLAMACIITVHVWRWLPFWTLIFLAARLAIPKDLYEASEIDGAGPLAQFRYVTFPSVAGLYVTSLVLSTIWSLGDFNSVYLLTGGGPGDSTHVLATLGIRYAFGQNEVGSGVAAVITALPVLLPLLILLLRRLRREQAYL